MSSCNILLRSCSARNSSVKQGVRHTRRLKLKKNQVNIILSKKKHFWITFTQKKLLLFSFFKKKVQNKQLYLRVCPLPFAIFARIFQQIQHGPRPKI